VGARVSALDGYRDGFVTAIQPLVTAAALTAEGLSGLVVYPYPRPGGQVFALTLDAGDESADEGEGYFIPDSAFGAVGAISLVAQLVVPIRSDIPTTLRVVDKYITTIVSAIHSSAPNDTRVTRVGRPIPVAETTDDGSSPTAVAVAFALRVLL
jgi:hypothetical protein